MGPMNSTTPKPALLKQYFTLLVDVKHQNPTVLPFPNVSTGGLLLFFFFKPAFVACFFPGTKEHKNGVITPISKGFSPPQLPILYICYIYIYIFINSIGKAIFLRAKAAKELQSR